MNSDLGCRRFAAVPPGIDQSRARLPQTLALESQPVVKSDGLKLFYFIYSPFFFATHSAIRFDTIPNPDHSRTPIIYRKSSTAQSAVHGVVKHVRADHCATTPASTTVIAERRHVYMCTTIYSRARPVFPTIANHVL